MCKKTFLLEELGENEVDMDIWTLFCCLREMGLTSMWKHISYKKFDNQWKTLSGLHMRKLKVCCCELLRATPSLLKKKQMAVVGQNVLPLKKQLHH